MPFARILWSPITAATDTAAKSDPLPVSWGGVRGLLVFMDSHFYQAKKKKKHALEICGLKLSGGIYKLDNSLKVSTETAWLRSLRSAQPGCKGLREVSFEKWTLSRSGYRNRIPRERSRPDRWAPPRQQLPARTKERKKPRQKGPA